jgi:hypothetical protein
VAAALVLMLAAQADQVAVVQVAVNHLPQGLMVLPTQAVGAVVLTTTERLATAAPASSLFEFAQHKQRKENIVAHVARVDEDGIVREVHVLRNEDLPNNGEFSPETEAAANAFQHSLGLEGNWKLTSYNGNFRSVYAGIGYKYDEALDEFVAPEAPDAEVAE